MHLTSSRLVKRMVTLFLHCSKWNLLCTFFLCRSFWHINWSLSKHSFSTKRTHCTYFFIFFYSTFKTNENISSLIDITKIWKLLFTYIQQLKEYIYIILWNETLQNDPSKWWLLDPNGQTRIVNLKTFHFVSTIFLLFIIRFIYFYYSYMKLCFLYFS